MHKYNIEVVVQPTQVKLSAAFVIPLPEATFTAVTSYQNSKVHLFAQHFTSSSVDI